MVRQTTKVILLEVLGVFSLLLMATLGLFAYALSQGPLELGMFRDDVERAIAQARNGRPVSMERLTLQWSPADRRLFVVANGLSLRDKDGREAGWAERANLTLDAGSAIRGRVEVIDADLQTGWLELRNTGPNSWTLAGEPLPPVQAGRLPQSPREWVDRINEVLSDILGGLGVIEGGTTFEAAAFDVMQLRIVSQAGDRLATIEDASGALARSDGTLQLTLAGAGEGVGLPGRFELSIAALDEYQSLLANLDVGGWPLPNLLERFGFGQISQAEDVTVGTHFAAEVSRDNGLEAFDVLLGRQAGQLDLPVIDETVLDFNAYVRYRPRDDTISLERIAVRTERFESILRGTVDNVLAENSLRRLNLEADQVDLDLSPYFPAPWSISDVALEADVSDDFTLYAVNSVTATVDDVLLRATGDLDLDPPHEDGQVPVQLELSAEAVGDISKNLVLAFWPETLGTGARSFVASRLETGTVPEASARFSLKPDSLEEGWLRDEDLTVRFSFQDGTVRFLNDVPPIEDGMGTATLNGNSFSLELMSGRYDDWALTTGLFEFPAFNPRGGSFYVSAEGEGPVRSILRHLSESRLRLEETTGFEVDRLTGDATANFYMERPALSDVPFEDTRIKVLGKISDASLEDVALGLDLRNASAELDLTNDRMIVTGFGDVGTAPVQFSWRDGLVSDDTPAALSASAIISPDVLNAFGLVGRAYLSGEIPVEIQGAIGANGLDGATFAFDLRDSRIAVDEIGWSKPAGEAARATLTYKGGAASSDSTLRLESERAKLDGDLRLSTDGRLERLELRRLFIQNTADVAGTVLRADNGALDMKLTGPFLDVSPLLADFGGFGDAAGPSQPLGIPIVLNASVDLLRLRRGLVLRGAELDLENARSRLISVEARGETRDGADIGATYFARNPAEPPTIGVTSSDAGFLAQAFFGVDFISGGDMRLSGTVGEDGAPTRLTVRISNARLVNAPFVTQILSLASLRGLSDTLSGDGVLFTDVVVPLTIARGRYVVEGGRASGPALGLTVNGFVSTENDGIELNGVLVPSFGVNSMLGGVPVIGDLFVGRDGEGIFSITYSVSGTLNKAQVAVNPLSAVTPGILRRIFENPSDTSIPDSLPTDPDRKPPTAKLPDLPEDEFIESAPGGG